MRTIAVASGDRSEYGFLRPVARRIEQTPGLRLSMLLCRWHIKHGTFKDAKTDGFPFKKIPGMNLGRIHDEFYKHFREDRPDILLVLGDRGAVFQAAYAAARHGIVIAHVHGGDRLDSGHIDEAVRHSITRFAHIHFAACASSAERLKKMGEQPFRVKKVGSPVIDSYLDTLEEKVDFPGIARAQDLNPHEGYILCMQHPNTLETDEAGRQMRATLSALDQLDMPTLILHPNGDPGRELMMKEIAKIKNRKWARVEKSVHHRDFCHLFKNARAVVGNSSAGLIEGSYFNVPYVCVGSRNTGREHGKNVIFTTHDSKKILPALKKTISPGFRKKLAKSPSPYGRGRSSEKIVNILKNLNLDDKLMLKRLTY